MATDTPLWEALKENAAPLQRGRSVQALERSLAVDMTESFRLQIERQIEYYERKVRPSEAADAVQTMDATENPLQYWMEYIKFHQENFPTNTREQKLLLERCVRALIRFQKYANNVTFVVSICCNYASKSDQQAEIFNFLYHSNIGTQVAKFYAAWAYVAETQEDFEEAKKIFELGIRNKAEPVEYLLGRQYHFHRRMNRHWINATAIVDDMEDSEAHRGALGGLSEEAFRKNDRGRQYQHARGHQRHHQWSSSTSQATFVDRSAMRREAPRSNLVNSGGAFAIFVDENENSAPPLDDTSSFVANPDRQLEREEDRRKENTRNVERWNASGGYAPMYDAAPQPPAARRARTTTPFAVHVDEELAAQHEEEAKQEEARIENMRRHRDERTFRQRDGQGVEDKLARDPLRYVRNPSKLEEDKRRAEKEDNKRRGREQDARMEKLLKNEFGEEQCFHEARASANYYKLAPAAWNINRFIASPSIRDESDMSVDESTDDVSMADQQSPAKMNISFSQKMPPQRPPPLSTRSFSRNDSMHSYTDPTPRNTSTASSTVDEAVAVGAVGEPTINTQLAIKELSMMFSSPAMGLNESLQHPERHGGLGPILNESGVSEAAGADAMTSIDEVQEEDDIMEANDLAVDSSLVVGPENQSLPNPHARTTDSPNFDDMALRTLHEDQGGSSVGCSSQGSTRSAGELSQDDPFRALGSVELQDEPGFQIYQDEERDQNDNRYPLIAKREAAPHPAPAPASQPFAFEIFQDPGDSIAGGGVGLQTVAHSQQNVEHAVDDNAEKQDANKSVFDILDEELEAMSQIIEELDAEEGVGADRGKTTFDVNVSGIKMLQSDPSDSDPPAFGDISRIHQTQECTESIGPAMRLVSEMAIDYPTCHKNDVVSAMARLKEQSCKFPPNRRSLFKILQSGEFVCDVPSHKLQETLRLPKQGGAAVAPGTEIRFGKSSATVKRELGRGSYGRVALLEPDPSCQQQLVALKAQSPTNCLAWEFEILKKVQDRIGPQYQKGRFPYSVPLSYISLFDGALLAMTAASSSGFNLVDLANVYRSPQHNRTIPEVVVMHYTAKMLLRVEEVHWHGKILHCDVKPDNWALCSSIIDGETVLASDLQLIDFGRAIDLTSHQTDRRHVMETKFTGKATTNDMMCVAMREGLPWSFDIDTFGICASVHILLYGTHIVIEKEKGRWMPKERVRRYQNKIWHEFFYNLLNLKDGVALGSHPLSLRRLREQFERELEGKEAKLASELKGQARFLPPTPPRAY